MSIIEEYRDQFRIYLFDKDFDRSGQVAGLFEERGYSSFARFNDLDSFNQGLKSQLPHIMIVYYQPLDLEFRKMISTVREESKETEIIILGSNDFWPGIKNLLNNGLVNDFWSWPLASNDVLQLRLDQLIEKNIYRYIGEQRSEETADIVQALDKLKERAAEVATLQTNELGEMNELVLSGAIDSETTLSDELLERLKSDYPESDFAYLKYYRPKEQVLIYKTSFCKESFYRGQVFSYTEEQTKKDAENNWSDIRNSLTEMFGTKTYQLYPIQLADKVYGFIAAFNFPEDQIPYLERATRYVSLAMRNMDLEKEKEEPYAPQFSKEIPARHFFESLSKEVSRARRIIKPVTLLLAHIQFVGEEKKAMAELKELFEKQLRVYDFFANINENEIAIVLPHCDFENGAIKAERLRRLILNHSMQSQNTPLRCCFGVAEFPRLSEDTHGLLDAAKAACDQVLTSGKNKVCLYTQKEDFEPEFQV